MDWAQTQSTSLPKRPFSVVSTGNPRRSHPLLSVSLPKHKKAKLDQTSDGSDNPALRNREVSSSVPLLQSRGSSSEQSATRWFVSRNENVVGFQDSKNAHEFETPFYLAREASSHELNKPSSHNEESFEKRGRLDTENDELRDVIDDLTVENKRLKNMLRDWRTKSAPTSSNLDRVFEVRAHGLSVEKKRQLEELLRRFTGQLGESSSQSSFAKTSSTSYMPKATQKATFDSVPADSGYSSISHSGITSNSQSGAHKFSGHEPVSKSKKDTDIKNYLHDIPDSHAPGETASVSENAKMVLVVQRLEHLFVGNSAAGEHAFPIQQQQISRSAARADRLEERKSKRTLKMEGLREAHILPIGTKINLDAVGANSQAHSNQSSTDRSSKGNGALPTSERAVSPDQRPTRPLDLDIHRAQVAAENIDYIRHLGMSSPQFEDTEGIKDQPWMYLNLLISMAQLHTLNVTPAFVRRAIQRVSTKFELSQDGHKIRWKGASRSDGPLNLETSGTPLHRWSDKSGYDRGCWSGRSTASTLNNASVTKSDEKLYYVRSSLGIPQTSRTALTKMSPPQSTSTFDYKPVVFQGIGTDPKADESYLDSSSSCDDMSLESGEKQVPRRRYRKPQTDSFDGYMVFFNNSHFFTDLSGDRTNPVTEMIAYRASPNALGASNKHLHGVDDTVRDANACYFLNQTRIEDTGWNNEFPHFEMSIAPVTSAGESEKQPIELEASGIGGVRPEDSFVLDVEISRQKQTPRPGRSLREVRGKRTARYYYTVESCRKWDLQPSRLPPPSYVVFTTSSSSGAETEYRDADDDSETSSEAEQSSAPAFMRQWSSNCNERQDDSTSLLSSSDGVLEAARASTALAQDTISTNRSRSGSYAATAGASWCAASNFEGLHMRHDEDGASEESMSMEHGL